jgi:hypothetical protein
VPILYILVKSLARSDRGKNNAPQQTTPATDPNHQHPHHIN